MVSMGIHRHPCASSIGGIFGSQAGLCLVLLLAGLVACGRQAPPPVPALVPVDRQTGLPSARLAIDGDTVASFPIATGQGPWAIDFAQARPIEAIVANAAERGLAGVRIDPLPAQPGQVRLWPQLRLDGLELNAADVDVLRLRAAFDVATVVRIYLLNDEDIAQQAAWREARPGLPAEPTFTGQRYVERQVQPSRELVAHDFAVGQEAAWSGTIHALRVDAVFGQPGLVLEGLEAMRQPMTVGPSARLVDGELVDAGVVTLLHDPPGEPGEARSAGRRAHPALAGRPMRLDLPEGLSAAAALSFSIALPRGVRPEAPPARFTLAAKDGPRAGELLFERTLTPANDADRWFPERIDLPAGTTALVVRADAADVRGDELETVRLAGLFGPFHLVRPDVTRPRSVLLISADTLRADHLSSYARALGIEPAVETPNLDALVARGVAFLDTLAPANVTSPSHASLLTGLYPKDHGVLGNRAALPHDLPTAALLFSRRGWATGAVVGVRHLNVELARMGRGFDVFMDTPPPIMEPVVRDPERPWLEPWPDWGSRPAYRGAREVHRDAFELLDEWRELPWFLWLHYFDPHTPYGAEEPFLERYVPADREEGPTLLEDFARRRLEHSPGLALWTDGQRRRRLGDAELAQNFAADAPHLAFLGDIRDPRVAAGMYAAGVAQLDRDLGELFALLEAQGRLDETLIVFTSDHGEALGEQDIWFEHAGVYDSTLRIPLVFAGPGVPARGFSREPAELVDVLPTLCELFDLPVPLGMRGRSLVPAFGGEERPRGPRWFQHAENLDVGFQDEGRHFVLTRRTHPRGTLQVPVEAGSVQWLELLSPQGHGRDLAPAEPERVAELTREVERWLSERSVDIAPAQASLSEADRESLRRLGYLGDD